MRSEIKTNLKLFNTGAIRCKSELARATYAAMKEGMEEFMQECLDESPSCPFKSGDLYQAHHISVSPESRSSSIGMLNVKGIPYAASQHEGVSRHGTDYMNYTRPGSGSHWISSKVLRVSTGRSPVLQIITRSISRFLKRIFRG